MAGFKHSYPEVIRVAGIIICHRVRKCGVWVGAGIAPLTWAAMRPGRPRLLGSVASHPEMSDPRAEQWIDEPPVSA